MDIFDNLEGFSRNEKYQGENAWGNPDKMDHFILWIIAGVRAYIRKLDPSATITIHCGYELTGHNGKTHQEGWALDYHINTVIPYHELISHVEDALRELGVYEFVGLGIYPDWYTPGFHTDVRLRKARWGYILDRIKSTPENRVYKAISFEVAKDYAMLTEAERAI